MASFGETAVDFNEPMFSSAEASDIAGSDPDKFTLWRQRGQLPAGTRHRATGRYLFSVLDIVRLRAMCDLVDTTGMSPVHAAKVGEIVAEWFDRRISGVAPPGTETRILVSLVGGEPELTVIHHDGDLVPLPSRGGPAERYRRCHVMVPADAIGFDVMHRAFAILEAEHDHPPRKIGTVNGVPIDQWREAIEGELARMDGNL